MVELVPGMGVKISQRQLKMTQKSRGFSQYTRNLMMLVFTMRELTMCSVTGFKATGRGSQNAVPRPALEQTRVHAIIGKLHNILKKLMSLTPRSMSGLKPYPDDFP